MSNRKSLIQLHDGFLFAKRNYNHEFLKNVLPSVSTSHNVVPYCQGQEVHNLLPKKIAPLLGAIYEHTWVLPKSEKIRQYWHNSLFSPMNLLMYRNYIMWLKVSLPSLFLIQSCIQVTLFSTVFFTVLRWIISRSQKMINHLFHNY